MTVLELQRILEKCPPDAPVIIEHLKPNGDIDYVEATIVNEVECDVKSIANRNETRFWATETKKAVKII